MTAENLHIKPIIRELVRTQVCFPDIKLLVDRVNIIELPNQNVADHSQAYRLFLTDREKTIQAVVKRRLHRMINSGEIREGSFVVLKDYCLARAKRRNSDGEVVYLQIADFYSVGEEARSTRETSPTPLSPSNLDDAQPLHHPSNESNSVSHPLKRKHGTAVSEPESKSNKRGQELGRSAPELEKQTDIDGSPDFDTFKDSELQGKRPGPNSNKDVGSSNEESIYSAAHESYVASNAEPAHSNNIANAFKPINRPLKLSTLSSVTGANRSKNEVHDVLALIVHVDAHTYKPPRMPRKRDLRIMDSSTSKRVVLSVFTDPVGFGPKPGTVALFRNLTTHDWDGGNVKAYPWLCEGRAWFVPVPDDGLLEGIDREEVERLRTLRDNLVTSEELNIR